MIIQLHSGTGFISQLIRWQTRSKFSHASVVLDDGSVIESREFCGVRQLATPERRMGESITRFWVPLSSHDTDSVTAFLRAQLGKPYDYISVLRFISRRGYDRYSRNKFFCSELVFAAFKHAGIDLLSRCEAWEVSPGLLAKSPLLYQR